MSLLMDALRRAEEEKKQQEASARKQAETPASAPGAETSSLTVETAAGPEDVTVQIESSALEEESAEIEVPPAQLEMEPLDSFEDGDSSRSMTLPDGLELEPLEGDDDIEPGEIGLDDTRSNTLEQGAADATGATTRGGARDRAEQTSTLPSTRAVQHDLEAYFDQSHSVELPRGENRSPADATLEDVAAHTVVGAQTVFTAGERRRSRPLFVAAGLLAVMIVVGIGVVGIFYARQTPEQRFMPSPDVADGVERQDARELPVVPLDPRTADAAAVLPRIDTRPPPVAEADTGPLMEAHDDLMPPSVAAAPAVEAAPLSATSDPALTSPQPEPAPFAAAPTPPEAPPVTTPPAAAPEPVFGVSAGEVRISRNRKPAAVDADVQTAYEAFTRGDIATARSRYEAALAGHPDRRDALLGLGAIALGEGDLELAYRHYAAVLERFPYDPVASAALLSLTGGAGGTTAARLRMLLDDHGDSAFIHFALGNWYARQGRWGDAQQAYFSAVRLDAENADYHFNLAVSLDRMGQGAAALNYYQKSLSLADGGGGNFNPANALQRISNLSSASAP